MLKKPYLPCLLALLITALVPLEGVPSTGEYGVERTTRPLYLQSLIDPQEDPGGLAWLGADAATSVEITSDRYVWLFGDTILGEKKGKERKYSVFIHNTIGVAKRADTGEFRRINKHFRKENGKDEAVFSSEKDQVFYWPLVGTTLDSSLLVAANRVTTKDTENFEVLGTSFFVVENPEEPPEVWDYEGYFLPKEDGITWGSALVRKGDRVYVFGQKGSGLSAKTVLTRIGVEDAANGDWKKRVNFAGGRWKADASPTPVKGLPGSSERTVQYNPFFGWYSLRIPAFSFDIHLYTAQDLTGPWRDQGKVYTVPPPWRTEKTDDGKHVFSVYAPKSHPELAEEENEIVLTYNINLNPFVPGLSDELQEYIEKEKYEELYVPQFVSLEFRKTGTD